MGGFGGGMGGMDMNDLLTRMFMAQGMGGGGSPFGGVSGFSFGGAGGGGFPGAGFSSSGGFPHTHGFHSGSSRGPRRSGGGGFPF